MIIYFVCNNPECDDGGGVPNSIKKHYKNSKDIAPFLDCGACGTGKLERQLSAPTSKSTQVVDNGFQARKTELLNAVVDKEKDRLDRGE